jgi:hypothetical protein
MRRTVLGLLILPVTACVVHDVQGPGVAPAPAVVYGPPGGDVDPGYGYGGYGAQNQEMPGDPQGYGDAAAPATEDGSQVEMTDPQAVATVTDVEIDATLDGYGEWVDDEEYGRVWRPYATVVGQDFTPYETCGSWVWTDYGWTYSCDWDWGWLPFHYGQWDFVDDGWAWIPGYEWSPAWVDWRDGGDYVGWRPSEPQVRDHRHPSGGGTLHVRDHRHKAVDSHWRFARVADFARPHIRSHIFRGAAEALGATTPVNKITLRGQQSVAVANLMNHRFASPSRQQAGGAPYRHPSYRPIDRAEATMPVRTAPPRTYEPTRGFTPDAPQSSSGIDVPVYGGSAGSPQRGLGPDGAAVQPPVFTPQPQAPVAPTNTYQAPTPGPVYTPPSRTWTPPPGSYQPPVSAPPTHYAPPTRYSPPMRHSSYSPPSRSYSPPSSYSAPSRSYSPPSSYSAPSRSYSSSSSYSAPSHSYSAPSHSYSSSSSSGGSYHSSSGGGSRHR